MKKQKNKISSEVIQNAKKMLVSFFPQISKKAFYVSNFKTSKIFPLGIINTYDSLVGDVIENSLVLRAYRKPKEKSSILYKVDEFNSKINQWEKHEKIKNHYIKQNITDDMMERNQMTVDFISDNNGNLKPNIQSDGMVKVYINFPDRIEEMRKKYNQKIN